MADRTKGERHSGRGFWGVICSIILHGSCGGGGGGAGRVGVLFSYSLTWLIRVKVVGEGEGCGGGDNSEIDKTERGGGGRKIM